jgi:hypothetical protein
VEQIQRTQIGVEFKGGKMGLLGDIISAPFKIVGAVIESVGEVTETKKLTNIVSKPLDAIGNVMEDIDE